MAEETIVNDASSQPAVTPDTETVPGVPGVGGPPFGGSNPQLMLTLLCDVPALNCINGNRCIHSSLLDDVCVLFLADVLLPAKSQ